jgi:hypothetical protein
MDQGILHWPGDWLGERKRESFAAVLSVEVVKHDVMIFSTFSTQSGGGGRLQDDKWHPRALGFTGVE